MKKIEKKLSLNKTNLTVLDKDQLNTVKGGEGNYVEEAKTKTRRKCSGCPCCPGVEEEL
jgi:natural product precursor